MTGTNKFLPFATGGSANVITDDAYAALAALATGYQSGIAQSQQLNKTWRQSSVMAAVMGQIIANYGNNASDGDSIANLVAYLKAALMGSKASIGLVSSAATLTFANVGQLVELQGATNYTVTMPLSTACVAGGVIGFHNTGSATVTISRQGADVFAPKSTTITSITLAPGDTAEFASNANGTWYLTEGSVLLPYAGVMAGANWTTPAQFDNSTKLATTEFVKKAIGSYSNFWVLTASDTGNAGYAGSVVYLGGSPGSTLTLPPTASFVNGTAITFFANTAWTIAANTGQAISNGANGSGTVTSITLGAGDSLELIFSGGSWYIVGGSAGLKNTSSFAASLNQSGYQKLPNGLILQWGKLINISYSQTNYTVTFPIAFPNAFLNGSVSLCQNGYNSDVPSAVILNTPGASSMVVGVEYYTITTTGDMFWFALGY